MLNQGINIHNLYILLFMLGLIIIARKYKKYQKSTKNNIIENMSNNQQLSDEDKQELSRNHLSLYNKAINILKANDNPSDLWIKNKKSLEKTLSKMIDIEIQLDIFGNNDTIQSQRRKELTEQMFTIDNKYNDNLINNISRDITLMMKELKDNIKDLEYESNKKDIDKYLVSATNKEINYKISNINDFIDSHDDNKFDFSDILIDLNKDEKVINDLNTKINEKLNNKKSGTPETINNTQNKDFIKEYDIKDDEVNMSETIQEYWKQSLKEFQNTSTYNYHDYSNYSNAKNIAFRLIDNDENISTKKYNPDTKAFNYVF